MTKMYDIMWLDSVDSTNSEAKRRISDIDNLSVLSALSQSEGRGQKGNKWSSVPGENLTFSIVLKFGEQTAGKARLSVAGKLQLVVAAREQFVLTEITSLSIVEFLSRHGIKAKIKWPNDIYVGDKKICGVLIENSLRGENLSSSIIGIGLNVNQRNFDVNLPNPTSMVLQTGFEEDIKGCLEEFMDIFQGYLEYSLPNLRERYLSYLWRHNTPARYIDQTLQSQPLKTDSEGELPGREFTGIIRGLSPIGHLVVEDIEKGELKEFAFKEISYIL
jgi:BirA family biotin operon repressor/biotin-[acetyl-CoA-carboxylase] ligase